jgi:DNA-binding GntR family transcriptional regulator
VSVNPDLPTPIYEQLASLLRAQIDSGEISGRLPSVTTLMQRHDIGSQDTVLRALTLLRDAGVIETYQRRGSFVSDAYKHAHSADDAEQHQD